MLHAVASKLLKAGRVRAQKQQLGGQQIRGEDKAG
jgi:hypothetical protein